MKTRYLVIAALAAGFTAATVSAEELRHPSGQAIAFTCAGCHGTDGRSQGVAPDLAGEEPEEIYEYMMEFKSGEEEGTIMNRIAKGYSEAEIRALADYFAQFED